MQKITKTRGLVLLAGVMALGQATLPSVANATAFAYTALEVSNFALNTSVFGGFQTFQFTSQPLSASLNGTTINSPSIQVAIGSGTSTDQTHLTLGSTGFAAENEWFGANRPTFENPNADFAIADSHQLDTRISTGFGSGNFGTATGAQVNGALHTGAADTGTDNSLSWNFNVSAGELSAAGGSITLDFSFDTVSTLFAQTEISGETARATLNMSIELVQDGVVIASATVFDENANLQFPGTVGSQTDIAASFTDADFDPMIITAAGNYSINILYDSSAQVASADEQNLPEPGTIGLLGLGLIGLGVAGYRRRRA